MHFSTKTNTLFENLPIKSYNLCLHKKFCNNQNLSDFLK